jgi:uncharacterized repeat protein (TIGR01451 family)
MITQKLRLLLAMALGLALLVGTVALLGAQSQEAADLQPRSPGVLTVCKTAPTDCQYATIQEAVSIADDGDLIKVATGVYTDINNLGGADQVVYVSKTVTLRGGYLAPGFADPPAPEINTTALDARQTGRVLRITGDISATVEGLQLMNGEADAGGGIYILNAAARLLGNRIISNTASVYGGGIFMINSSSTLEDNQILNNGAYIGAGMSINGGDGTLHQNTISGNAAGDTGGGLHVEGADLTLTGNTFYSNTSNSGGGGVFAEERSQLTMTNNLVADNQPVGVLVLGSTANMQHTTLARNGAYGISLTDQEGEYSTVNMTNTLLSGHTAAGVYVYAGNTANLEGTLWGSEDWSGDGTILTGTVNFWGDPDFVNPGSGDFHIGPDSAAIDHAVYTEVSVDIDGDPRPYGASADIGADEYASMVWVTKDAFPDTVQAGAQLTYTLLVTNNGAVDLTASITDELPAHVTPSGLLTWGPVSITPHDTWTKTVVVTVENEYSGTLVNVVQVNTVEGATDIYTETSHALFTPSNQAPYTPSNPTPADGATAVPITQTLSWQGGDPDDDLVTYTVSLGATDPPPIVVTTTLTAYSPVLAADTTYYWLVTATDGISVSTGQIWHFTTADEWHNLYLPLVLKTG